MRRTTPLTFIGGSEPFWMTWPRFTGNKQGRYAAAEPLHRLALAIYQKQLSPAKVNPSEWADTEPLAGRRSDDKVEPYLCLGPSTRYPRCPDRLPGLCERWTAR